MGVKNGLGGLTSLQMLLLLSKKGRSGYELMSEIGAAIGKRPSAGQIYPLLAKMEKFGYVRVSSRGAREKKVYEISAAGRTALRSMVEKANIILDAILADKLKECEHCSCVIYEKGYSLKAHGKTHYYCCESCSLEKTCKNCDD